MGLGLVWRLVCGGHRVTLLSRGNLTDPFGDRVERIRADRASDAFDAALAGRTFDRAVDFAGFSADDAARAVRVLAGRVGHLVFISTGQVYLVREGCPAPLIEAPPPPGQAFNLAQPEQLTVRALIERIARRLGARPELVELPAAELEDAGLSVRAASPFSSAWMSLLDPARAVAELGFEHPPLDAYLDSILASLLAAWPATPPEGYAQRAQELELLRRLRG